ncbi:hypothetical protein O6P43_005943 [Quillaja saponaria]|uniref:Uncharacterized protein n=1 Tax=Quillaja saponaria TaxID=32244 RepID=A0AAD7Q796_QUISA|nr:hypothetical protein O6P43_005943 [Quillaja saponaria]
MSIEALAMAGIDYRECGINLDEWESQEQPPPYLLDDQQDLSSTELDKKKKNNNKRLLANEDEWMKAKMREWAKAVASKNVTVTISLQKQGL